MTAHKHAAMIKAKADNMDLVLFSMSTGSDYGKWSECKRETMPKDNENIKYFLCLPQHQELCLHWLNGGCVQLRHGKSQDWDNYVPIKAWTVGSIFMREYVEIRIKPRKEKRWIGFSSKLNVVTSQSFNTRDSLVEYVNGNFAYPECVQAVEIEIEV